MNENAYCWCHRVGPWRLKAPEMRRVLPAVGLNSAPCCRSSGMHHHMHSNLCSRGPLLDCERMMMRGNHCMTAALKKRGAEPIGNG